MIEVLAKTLLPWSLVLKVTLADKLKADQFTLDDLFNFPVKVEIHHPVAHHVYRFPLNPKHSVIHIFLPFGEFATYRYSAGQVCVVVRVLSPDIQQKEIACFARPAVLDIMKHDAVRSRCNDRGICMT